MAWNEYHFVDDWRVRGTCEEVDAVLSDAASYPRWWPSTYREVVLIEEAPPGGVGELGRITASGWLPYRLRFRYRVVEAHRPYGFTLQVRGDLTGRGEWSFRQDGDHVAITFDWRVRARKPVVRLLSPLLKPLFRSNHAWTMRKGERSLRLELRHRRATSDEERDAIPPPPGPASIRRVPGAMVQGIRNFRGRS
jgi:hypothetical protein